jgi:hypothetical protein
MTIPNLSRHLAAACFGLALAGAPVIAHAAPVAAPAAATAPATTTPTHGDAARASHDYAAREAAAPQTADFKGQGAGIYIGGSTLAVVLVVVLVVILL